MHAFCPLPFHPHIPGCLGYIKVRPKDLETKEMPMEKELLDYTASKVEEMLVAPSASADTKNAAQAWKDAIAAGKDADEATSTLLDAISAHQATIDDLIGFMSSDKAKELFGADVAAKNVAHAEERKAKGAKWCDCAACRPCHELLHRFGREEADVYL
jgi:hypothetical protein